ncbi:hypothetical protein [Actinomycetospora termitidis]|uniref:Uncharacterized protein n=1 Tax=Actinomycetospora termitidis TaxID=3053470 RepID=A0ABT7MHS5_9PSEU|nr:hypothetical protein [Actinomycetospora sp. Odt1-22]MDL5159437.1 hypothetical protein [Actinomycetospora sp. Odt1-22]
MTTDSTTATADARKRQRATLLEVENFLAIAEGLGVGRDVANARALDLCDERPDLDNAEVFILVLREIVDGELA